MPNLMQIQELLKGYTVDKLNIQSVGNMTVVPIIGDVEFTNVADINEVAFTKDINYNSLEFKNSSGKIGIAMQGWSIIDSQPAQDRTLPYAHLIKAANAKILPANCIQHTQCGHFDTSKWSQDNFMILPPSLRGVALKNSTHQDAQVGALWSSLSTWANGLDCDHMGLTSFYSKFQDKLDQFVAQFEPVEKQLGAIVLINGEVVAVDIMPKYDSWKAVWRAFIRDSYGAEAVRSAHNDGVSMDMGNLDAVGVKTLDDLEEAFEKMKENFYDSLQSKVGSVTQLSVGYRKLEQINELSMLRFESDSFTGQGVIHGDSHFIYVSLVKTGSTAKKREKFNSLRDRNPYGTGGFFFRN